MTRKMTVRLSLCAFIPLVAAAAACGSRVGNGKIVTKPRDLAGFTAVRNDTNIDLNVYESAETTVSVTIDENLQDAVTLRVVDGMLVLDTNPSASINSPYGGHVDVTLPHLMKAELDGTGSVRLHDITAGDRLTLVADGVGKLEYVGTVPVLDVSLDGLGDITLAGSADSLAIRSDDFGSIYAKDLVATSAEIRSDGSGNVYVRLGGGTLSIGLYGAGNIEWWGEANVTQSIDEGSGALYHR